MAARRRLQLVLLALSSAGPMFSLARSQVVELPPDNAFLRRAMHSLAIVGNYLYIEGGEVSQYVDGVLQNQPSNAVNVTLSIPLDVVWTNRTVVITEIDKGEHPAVKNHALWTPGGDSNVMYSWGGEAPYYVINRDAQNPRLRVFTADGRGGGTWGYEELPLPRDISRATWASWTSCGGAGFYMGGFGLVRTDVAKFTDTTQIPVPGLLSYNFTTKAWANDSATAFTPSFGTNIYGSAVCLPSVGTASSATSTTASSPGGLVVFLGGGMTNLKSTRSPQPLPLTNVSFYDVAAKRWHSQTATGDMPPLRHRTCAVAVQGQGAGRGKGDISYEIFMYGGGSSTGTTYDEGLDDMYVLTIPAFRWFRLNATMPRRQTHSCIAVPGKRLMINVGGCADDYRAESFWTVDPWTKGIGVFDMSTLAWADRYDPSAGAYQTPEVVRALYRGGHTAKWDNEDTQRLFVASSLSSGGTNTTTSRTADSGSQGATASGSPSPTGLPSSINATAIIGGAVGGGAFLSIVAIAVYVWYALRRLRASGNAVSAATATTTLPSPPSSSAPTRDALIPEADSSSKAQEMDSSHSQVVLQRGNTGPHEMPMPSQYMYYCPPPQEMCAIEH